MGLINRQVNGRVDHVDQPHRRQNNPTISYRCCNLECLYLVVHIVSHKGFSVSASLGFSMNRTFICGTFIIFHLQLYLQQDQGHLWDLEDLLGQEDPKTETGESFYHNILEKHSIISW